MTETECVPGLVPHDPGEIGWVDSSSEAVVYRDGYFRGDEPPVLIVGAGLLDNCPDSSAKGESLNSPGKC